MTTARTQADEIQRRMAEVRSRLHYEMTDVVQVASAAVDWRSHIRAHPWLAIGASFAAGYLLVPSKKKEPARIIALASDEVKGPREVVTSEKSNRSSLLGWALGSVSQIALRAARGYALNYVESLLTQRDAGPRPQADTPASETGSGGSPRSERLRQTPGDRHFPRR